MTVCYYEVKQSWMPIFKLVHSPQTTNVTYLWDDRSEKKLSWSFTTSCLLFCKLELITVYTGYDRTELTGPPPSNVSCLSCCKTRDSKPSFCNKEEVVAAPSSGKRGVMHQYTRVEWMNECVTSWVLICKFKHFFHGTRLSSCSDLNPRCQQNVLSTVNLPNVM